ncbi:hypothetical protein A7982_13176 [Minicystis rosea]|nr:hypothetical protein A7982_13176 [Minicystis rosea]
MTSTNTTPTWETYCAETYCPLREKQAADTGCDMDPTCYQGCLALESCADAVKALAECSKTAKLACYQDSPVQPSRVDLALGECTSASNVQHACLHGPCDPLTDSECAPVACPDGTFARLCKSGTCVEDPSVVCAPTTACTSADFTDVCPSLLCDGGIEQQCTTGGVCRVACN